MSEKVVGMTQNINEFISSMDYLASNNKAFTFIVDTPEYSAVVISKILEYSKREIRMYEDCLNGEIAESHENFYSALRKFFLDGKTLKMVLRHPEPTDTKIYNYLADAWHQFPGQVDIRLAHSQFKESMKDVVNDDLNFTVNDKNALRLELLVAEMNHEKRAICNFNDENLSDKLRKLFDREFEQCPKQHFNLIQT